MRHGWRPLQRYIEVHERVLRIHSMHMDPPKVYREEWINPNYHYLSCEQINFTTFYGNKIRVDIRIDVDVDDSVPNRKKAKTFVYTFSAYQPGGNPLIRYCSPHDEDHLERTAPHHRDHHKHDFTSGKEQITIIDAELRPHVGEFLNEVLTKF